MKNYRVHPTYWLISTQVCAAFVADATAQDSGAARAAALGVFQGLSVGGAFIVGFPMAAILSKGGKYRKPMYLAASLQLLNAFLALFVTPCVEINQCAGDGRAGSVER